MKTSHGRHGRTDPVEAIAIASQRIGSFESGKEPGRGARGQLDTGGEIAPLASGFAADIQIAVANIKRGLVAVIVSAELPPGVVGGYDRAVRGDDGNIVVHGVDQLLQRNRMRREKLLVQFTHPSQVCTI